MYTLEERMKAVQLYIESGFSEGAVVSELGYPSYTALRYWYSEYKQNGKLHRSSAPKPHYLSFGSSAQCQCRNNK